MSNNVVIDPLIRELMESAATGEAAKLFLGSGLGKHIAQRAADEVDEALAELIEADPNDAAAIRALQTRINVARQSVVYLAEAISEGDNALQQLHGED